MPKILDEYYRTAVRRQIIAIFQSPQGRDLGRWFLTEKGKGEQGNLGQIIKEIQDVEAEVIRDLYSSPVPVTNR